METHLNLVSVPAKIAAVRNWERTVGVWITDPHAQINFRNLLEAYTNDLHYCSGLGSPYVQASQRLDVVKAMVADIDGLLDFLATMEDTNGDVPAFAKEICKLLFGIACDLLVVINLIERGHDGQTEVQHG